MKELISIDRLKELKESNYKSISVKDEMRRNLITKLQKNEIIFKEIYGYEETVIPQIQNAILAKHNILFLGLRGQAKTRIARLLTSLLDEYIPIIKGSEINDNPLAPVSKFGIETLKELGDDTPISWIKRSDRYTEKLATPDVSVADLLGDTDPIKAANLKLNYSDENVIHFGLIPRANRGIFVINELPDLQARIQVALFNILQEKDIQIRGFKLRLPLDLQFIFTANPEDYTNRGSIVTPLKDRIGSQIITHYPKSINISKDITKNEANLTIDQNERIIIPELLRDIIEQVSIEARDSEYIDSKSGVSARMSISALENLVGQTERRLILNDESSTMVRVSDIYNIIPSITGKVELVYEGEQEGPVKVALILIGKAIKTLFGNYFPITQGFTNDSEENEFSEITKWFGKGNDIDLLLMANDKDYKNQLFSIPSLNIIVEKYFPNINENEKLIFMEFILHGLSENSLLSKHFLETKIIFKDLISTMFTMGSDDDSEDEIDLDQYNY